MKNAFKYLTTALFAAALFSCAELEQPEGNQGTQASGEKIKLVLNASKGETESSSDTKVFVGQAADGKVRYYWNENDQIGVIPFMQNAGFEDLKPNYVTAETQINPSNKNQAQFESYIQADGYKTATPDLLIYFPYNSSMLEGTTGKTGQDYARQGLTFRLPQQQEQYGYNRSLVGENASADKEHPSVWAISNYGLAYDLAGSTQETSSEGGQTVSSLKGDFTLDHVNTYFQFNVYGSESQNGKNYADGSWKVASIAVEAGHCEQTTDPNTQESVFALTNKINIAGTYKFTYIYNDSDFNNVAGVAGNEKITLSSVAPVDNVRVNMNNIEIAPALGGTKTTAVPTFAVINAAEIKSNPKGDLNCLKVSVTCYRYEGGNIVGSDTRTRYYNISNIVGTDISGNYYTIDFEVCDPVESYTDLSAMDPANCYVVAAPGNYTFNADIAGNGRLPYPETGTTIMGVDPKNLIQDGKKYAIDWLWASGLSFDAVKSGDMTDTEVVKQIINNVGLTGEKGEVSIGLAAGSTMKTLSGNILLALYEVNTDGTAGDIVWTWHLWLGMPEAQHYKFPATNMDWVFTNEDWYMLDRNIGAESNELGNPRSTGLYYQRSRKEPMIGFGNVQGSTNWTENQIPTYRNTAVFGGRAAWTGGMTYSNYNTLKYPMALMTGIPSQISTSEYYYAWSSSKDAKNENDITNDTKSMFDPCPSGYRMPTVREWDNLKSDIYYWIKGVQGSGVFGYCQWEGLPGIITANQANDERNIDYLARIAAGDYYEVNAQFERTYHIKHFSGTGSELITTFPNTGLLRGNGQWSYMHDDSYTTPIVTVNHPAGPQLSANVKVDTYAQDPAPEIGVNVSNSGLMTVTFDDDNSELYFSESVSGSKQLITDSPWTYQCNISHNSSKTYYFYTSETSAYTSVSVKYKKNDGYNVTGQTQSTPNTTTTAILTVNFTDPNGAYSYSKTDGGSRTAIAGSTLTLDCAGLSYNGANTSTLYFYQTNSAGIVSNKTTVTVTRNGSSYYCGSPVVGDAYTSQTGGELISSEQSTMAVWTSGRIDDGSFYTYWFGPGNDTGDGWGSKQNGQYGYVGDGIAPFTERRETYGLTFEPVAIKRYDSRYSPEWNNDPALPIRCIREYDNSSTVTVAE